MTDGEAGGNGPETPDDSDRLPGQVRARVVLSRPLLRLLRVKTVDLAVDQGVCGGDGADDADTW